jgi:hypothetical protein
VQSSPKYKPIPLTSSWRDFKDYGPAKWREMAAILRSLSGVDFLWNEKLLVVRYEVAKQTRTCDKLRYVLREAATIDLL